MHFKMTQDVVQIEGLEPVITPRACVQLRRLHSVLNLAAGITCVDIMLVALSIAAAHAQPSQSSLFYAYTGLTTTHDGAHLYFSSFLRLKGTSQSPYPKILRW